MARRRRKFTLVGSDGKRNRVILIIIAAVVVVAVLIGALQPEPLIFSSPEIHIIQNRGVVLAGVRSDMPGFGSGGAGLEIELATLLAERILPDVKHGDAVKFVNVNHQSIWPTLSDGSIDFAICLMEKDADTKGRYIYSEPYYYDACYLAVQEGSADLALNEGVIVGYVSNTASHRALQRYINSLKEAGKPADWKTQAFASYPDMLFALNAARIDAAAIEGAYARRYQDDEHYGFTLKQEAVGTISYAIACSTESQAICELANMLLEDMRKDGLLDALINKHGLSASPKG